MYYLTIMKSIDALDHLDKVVPYDSFFQKRPVFLVLIDYFQEVASFSKLKDDAKALWRFIIEGFFVPNDVLVVNWSKNSYFIKSIWLFFGAKSLEGAFF